MPDTPPGIRDAATIILLRDRSGPAPSVLMGRRPAQAVFMPGKHVFPGGAVDAAESRVTLAGLPGAICQQRLASDSAALPATLAAAAIRELWEETGLTLGRPGDWPDPPPPGWAGFAARGLVPDGSALVHVFRAVTPPVWPRRFDTRFFMADAWAIAGDPDALVPPEGELEDLRWVPLADLGAVDLPRITRIVLAHVTGRLTDPGPPPVLPHFRGTAEETSRVPPLF